MWKSYIWTVDKRRECETELRSNEHYLSSSKNKACLLAFTLNEICELLAPNLFPEKKYFNPLYHFFLYMNVV